MPRIDSHQHFWRYTPSEYPWIPAGSALQRDWLPADLAPLLTAAGLDASIAVQARQTLEETEWLLSLADESPAIAGVVGWVDLRSDRVTDQLAQFVDHPKFVGVRHVVQDEPDPEFLLRPEFLRGLTAVQELDLVYDLLIYPIQLPATLRVVERFPGMQFVLDHIAKPEIRAGRRDPWEQQIRQLARFPNLVCKVSGMVTEANPASWIPDDLRPYLDVVFDAFGPRRLMFGSDWPVCLLAGPYNRVHAVVADYTAKLHVDEQAAIFGGVARAVYRLP